MRRLSRFLILMIGLASLALSTTVLAAPALAQEVEITALGRFDGWRENPLIGYGIVTGLAGTGDTSRSAITRQSLRNAYSRLGLTVDEADISSRNVAVVIVTANLPASANVGDRISVSVASSGDARSLAGGTLLMTPLLGPDAQPYALAQGPLVTGGYAFESELNLQQRNFPTHARIQDGASVERPVNARLLNADNRLTFLLTEPNFTTSARIAAAINEHFGYIIATAVNADEVSIEFRGSDEFLTAFIASLESIRVTPARAPRIVINERTGTIVAGADVTISSVAIAQGDIRVTVEADNYASQPAFIRGIANDVSSLIVTNTELTVSQGDNDVVASFPNTTVADLVQGLSAANVETRRIISILHAIKAAGALHADIIVQ